MTRVTINHVFLSYRFTTFDRCFSRVHRHAIGFTQTFPYIAQFSYALFFGHPRNLRRASDLFQGVVENSFDAMLRFSTDIFVFCFFFYNFFYPFPLKIITTCNFSRVTVIFEFIKWKIFTISLFLFLSFICSRSYDHSNARRQEIGNANVARSRRHEPGNGCFSNSRATIASRRAVPTLLVEIRNAVDPSCAG